MKGFEVLLKDTTAAGLARGEAQIAASLAKKVRAGAANPYNVAATRGGCRLPAACAPPRSGRSRWRGGVAVDDAPRA